MGIPGAKGGKKASFPPPRPPLSSSALVWSALVPLTSCHQGRVSPADGVRPGADPVSQQHGLSSDSELGMFCSPSLLFSHSPPSISSVFIYLQALPPFFPRPSSPLLLPSYFSPLPKRHSPVLIFSQLLQCLAKGGGTEVRARTSNVVTVNGKRARGSVSWYHVFLARESWVEGGTQAPGENGRGSPLGVPRALAGAGSSRQQ